MTSIDLRSTQHGGTWVRQFGPHEQGGFGVHLGDGSVHVELISHQITFALDRADAPSAWAEAIDVVALRTELITTICRKMSPQVLEELFREIHSQYRAGLRDGAAAARSKILEALGL